MKIVFLTVHDATSARKVDFHFWADVFAGRNFKVDFVTVGFSPFTMMKIGGRNYAPPFNKWLAVNSHIRKFLWCAPIHPLNLKNAFLNRLSSLPFSLYSKLMPKELLAGFADVDLFVVENGAGLMLVPTLAHKFPRAKFIYTVCDRIETLGYHPLIYRAERAALKHIDLIRVPAMVMVGDYPDARNIAYIPHGLDKHLFDAKTDNPYQKKNNAVCVGDMLFDEDAIETMARRYTDWSFHLFGKNAFLKQELPNVFCHGEQSFTDIIPYVQHADIGLAPYKNARNADYLSQSSMKMIQYTYCRLPIVAPHFAAAGRTHILPYLPGDRDSILKAMDLAIKYDRSQIDPSSVVDWDQTADEMLKVLRA